MTAMLAGGLLGLWLGMAVCGCGLWDTRTVRQAMTLRPSDLLRRLLLALGWAAVLTAFLAWLAVIDVDLLAVLPLHGGTLLGAAVFGAAAGLSGMLPGTAPVAAGGGRVAEGVCCMAGCILGAQLLPWLRPLTERLAAAGPWLQGTLFRVTLDEAYLLPGGFLAQGCVGAGLIALALLLPGERGEAVTEAPVPLLPAPEEPPSTDAQEVQADTVVALLPGEEAVVVDAAADAAERDTPEETEAESSADAEPESEAGQEAQATQDIPDPEDRMG